MQIGTFLCHPHVDYMTVTNLPAFVLGESSLVLLQLAIADSRVPLLLCLQA